MRCGGRSLESPLTGFCISRAWVATDADGTMTAQDSGVRTPGAHGNAQTPRATARAVDRLFPGGNSRGNSREFPGNSENLRELRFWICI